MCDTLTEILSGKKFDGSDMGGYGYTAYRRNGYANADHIDEVGGKARAFVEAHGEQRVWDLLTLAVARGDGERKTVVLSDEADQWQEKLQEIKRDYWAAWVSTRIGSCRRLERARVAYREHIGHVPNKLVTIEFERERYFYHPHEGSRYPERIDFWDEEFFVDSETAELYRATSAPSDGSKLPKDVYRLVDPVSRDTKTAVALAACLGLG